MNVDLRLDKPGTLARPGPIGRLVRFGLGAASLWAVSVLIRWPEELVSFPHNLMWFVWIAFGFHVFPYIVNIGFGRDWRRKPQIAVGALGAVGGLASIVAYGTLWGPPLGWLVWAFMVYTYGHLGISMVLAAVIATPGCEMRALPHLWMITTGRETAEHFCPGFLNGLDKWEVGRRVGN